MNLLFSKYAICYFTAVFLIKMLAGVEDAAIWYSFTTVGVFAWMVEDRFNEIESRISDIESRFENDQR